MQPDCEYGAENNLLPTSGESTYRSAHAGTLALPGCCGSSLPLVSRSTGSPRTSLQVPLSDSPFGMINRKVAAETLLKSTSYFPMDQ